MTVKLYDEDPYLSSCDAEILRCEKTKDGYAAVLDRTVFYARGGGQPCEGGTISGAFVLDVYEENGEVIHLLDREIKPGAARLEINMEKRFDHMQQHLGEHILSAVIERMYGGKIVILRIEPESSHIEIDRELTADELFEAECETNKIIAANMPVSTFFITPAEAAKRIPAHKAESHERVRIVEILGVDYNGCGGTHCRSTGEVGELMVCGTKLVRGVFRIYFKCGARAIAEKRERLRAILSLERAFGAELLPSSAEKALAALERKTALEEQNRALREALVLSDASLWANEGERAGESVFVARVYEGDAKHAKAVSDVIVNEHRAAVFLAVPFGGQLSLIFCRSKAKTGPDLGKYLRELATENGGKGGGSIISAQGMMADNEQSRAQFWSVCDRIKAELNVQVL